MRTALRRMGNSTGMIVPAAVLREAGIATGTLLDIAVEDGRIVAAPVAAALRSGWAADAAAIADAGEDHDTDAWADFGNDGDALLTW